MTIESELARLDADQMTVMDYHSRPELSASQINDFIDCPESFYEYHVARSRARDVTGEMDLGTLVHELVLEGHLQSAVEIPPEVLNQDGHRKGAKWKAFSEEHGDKILMTADQLSGVKEAASAVRSHPIAQMVLDGAETEREIFWKDLEVGVECRSRLDSVGTVIGDLKTVGNTLAFADYPKAFDSRGTYRQLGLYREGWFRTSGELLDVVMIVCEMKFPYRVQCYPVSDEYLELGLRECRWAMRKIEECRRTGVWRRDGWDKLDTVLVPSRWKEYLV